jgi:hemoglobin-like flavoprotein
MSPEQIFLVEDSLAALRPVFDHVVADFYRRLFETDPSLRALFTNDPAEQRRKLAEELDAIIASIEHHQVFLERTRRLGRRHLGYGVRAEHYATVGDALLGALGAAFDDAWTLQLEEAWRLAYTLTAEAMQGGAAAATADALV